MLNSFPEVAGARELESVPIALKPKQSSNGQLDKDKQIALICAEFPLNITVNMNTPKLSNTNIKIVDKINFLLNVLIFEVHAFSGLPYQKEHLIAEYNDGIDNQLSL